MSERYLGIDVGAETIKIVELVRGGAATRRGRSERIEHHKDPAAVLARALGRWDWHSVAGAAVTGRFRRLLDLRQVPTKEAQALGYRALHGEQRATVVSIGGRGFSVLELRGGDVSVYRENSRCSQGTGNFLRQLVARFGLTIEQASTLCADIEKPAPLSGRCPVILKTDMTHLANKGESQARILAGLYDAVCENVQVLLKPRLCPPRVMLIGGVTQSSRVREHFRRFVARHDMQLLDDDQDAEAGLFVEALGCAHLAAEANVNAGAHAPLDALLAPPRAVVLDRVPALQQQLDRVSRMQRSPLPTSRQEISARREAPRPPVIVGFDIGSTGSKVVAIDSDDLTPLWEGYVSTEGDPVGAAQRLMRQLVDGPVGHCAITALGATGSGREIVGSLLSTCYGSEPVYVLNEIAAHAEGALHYDREVDTIFEIGGQDAKYIRLAAGRVVDAAMNEACSAGTGSFIEEQGRKFSGIEDVVELGEVALEAGQGVSLGQHCSVFMAEIIDEAVSAGVKTPEIIAGIYDSIIQNYLNRVKGSRSVGQVIFCQGMPFSADALAAAVARQTGARVVIPPNPGTVGALGIALLTAKAIPREAGAAARDLDPQRFLEARVASKDTFVCKASKGCGGSGNRCRIDRLMTLVDEQRQRFTWGGGCSLWDRGTHRRKLPDGAPDPFRERDAWIDELVGELEANVSYDSARRGARRRVVALTDEFQLKGLFPFFATFLRELGFDLYVERGAGQRALKRGIEGANVPFCAPMQLYHGLVTAMAERPVDVLFLPMMRHTPRVANEPNAVVCPIVQGSGDILRWDLGANADVEIVSPMFDFGQGNLESPEFLDGCRKAAAMLGRPLKWWRAHQLALVAQARFETRCRELGRDALAFCSANDVTPIVVLGRPYTIYNTVLNSNVPAILREQGAMAIPVDCYPVSIETPVLPYMYYGYGQRSLRAAHQVRRSDEHYALWCSNYSCGPDSFNLHFFSYLMKGKPFCVIETDGHSGDAGTKTRVEAFLHCVREDQQARDARQDDEDARAAVATSLAKFDLESPGLREIIAREEHVLIPRMGPGAEALAACFRGFGVSAETLPMPDRETVRVGRRYTSGKECVPMCITVGSLLQRVAGEDSPADQRRYVFFMPTACGPCRFGLYHALHKITLERLGLDDRVRVWSPADSGYFDGLPAGASALIFTGFVTMDALLEGYYDSRATERTPGAAEAIYTREVRTLLTLLEQAGRGDLSLPATLAEVASGRLFGCGALLRRAGRAYAEVKQQRLCPTVLVVGEIYVRCDPFANDFVVDKLHARGIRVRFAPFTEWLEYTDYVAYALEKRGGLGARVSTIVQRRIQDIAHERMARPLRWPARTTVAEALDAAAPYVRTDLTGEAVLTVGGPLHEWRAGHIDGVVSVGPLECMPNKIAEAQFFHIAENDGLPSLTVPLNGDPIDDEVLDNFAFELHARHARGSARSAARSARASADERRDQPAQRLRRT